MIAIGGATVGAGFVGGALIVAVAAGRVLTAERRQRTSMAAPTNGDVLLVLGAEALPDGPSDELQARLDHAVERWRAGAAPVIGVSGGMDGEVDETRVMAGYVVSCGVPPTAVQPIVPGDNSRATMRAMAAADPQASVLAVSSPYHAHRLVAEGRRCGLQVVADCPATTPETANPEIRRTRLFGEVVGSILYAAPDWAIVLARRVAVPARRTLPTLAAQIGRRVRRGRWRPAS